MKVFGTWRKRHFLLSDTIFATALIALAITIAHFYISPARLPSLLAGIRTTLYGTASAGCATLLGFIITTTTITDAVVQGPKWEAFRNSLAYAQVQDIYFNTIRWLGFGTLIFLVFLVVDTDVHPQIPCEIISAWLVAIVVSRMWRSVTALELLLRVNSSRMTRE